MRGREEPTSPQGVANLMTADWLCMEHTDGRACACARARARKRPLPHLHRQWRGSSDLQLAFRGLYNDEARTDNPRTCSCKNNPPGGFREPFIGAL